MDFSLESYELLQRWIKDAEYEKQPELLELQIHSSKALEEGILDEAFSSQLKVPGQIGRESKPQ